MSDLTIANDKVQPKPNPTLLVIEVAATGTLNVLAREGMTDDQLLQLTICFGKWIEQYRAQRRIVLST